MQLDIETFAGKTGQYVFISSASVYEKPVKNYLMTERTPLENKYWQYSRDKIDCERLLSQPAEARLTRSCARATPCAPPSRSSSAASRFANRGLVVREAGDASPATVVPVDAHPVCRHHEAVRAPCSAIRGALNDDFHITTDRGFTWNQIHEAIARGFGVEAIYAHVPSDTLVRFNKDWEGPLLGDKTWSALFDNSKVKSVAEPFEAWPGSRRNPARVDGPRRGAAASGGPGHRRRGQARSTVLLRRRTAWGHDVVAKA